LLHGQTERSIEQAKGYDINDYRRRFIVTVYTEF
jgi:hypothetical protein